MSEVEAQPQPVAGQAFNQHPIRLVVADDLRRSRLTVLFRILLAIPHMIWVALWGIAAALVGLVQWVILLVLGRPNGRLWGFSARYLRYVGHVNAYLLILANPYPHFAGLPGDYPVDLQIDGPSPQARWKTLLRPILAIPAYIVSYIFNYLGQILSFVMWLVAVFTGRVPLGLRDFAAYLLRYQMQMSAYLYLLTDAYPALSTPEPKGPVEVVPPRVGPTLTGNYV
jgi:Domain of unknown function (DUF4389)